MRRAAALLAGLALLVAVPAALAVTLRDRDDVAVGVDIARAGGAHNRAADELVHSVDAYEPFTPKQMLNKDRPPSSFCVEIWTRSTPGEDPADYEACAVPDAKGSAWKASISRPRTNGHPLRIGPVKVEQPSETRLVLRIDPDDVKRPASYRWRAETTSFTKSCKSASGCPDFAPDRPATAKTALSKPR
jgi:hypothetical protein